MKKIFIIVALFTTMISKAQLNENAKYLKENYPEIYGEFKCAAIDKWIDDNSMIVYQINNQSNSLANVLTLKEKVSKSFYQSILIKWTDEKCRSTDYSMVEYEIKKQINNSNF